MGRKPKIFPPPKGEMLEPTPVDEAEEAADDVEPYEKMASDDGEELAQPEIRETTRKKRLSFDERQSILRDIKAGIPKKDLADKFAVSYSTIVNIEKSGEPVQKSFSREPERSSLHNDIFLFGFRVINGEKVSDEEVADLRERVQAEIKNKIQNIALSL